MITSYKSSVFMVNFVGFELLVSVWTDSHNILICEDEFWKKFVLLWKDMHKLFKTDLWDIIYIVQRFKMKKI